MGSGDQEDVRFLEAVRGLVDGAVKLLGADKGMGAWVVSGLLRKSGIIDVSESGVWAFWCFLSIVFGGSACERLLFSMSWYFGGIAMPKGAGGNYFIEE